MEKKKSVCVYKNYCYWHKIERALISLQVETSRLIVGSCRFKNAIPFKNVTFAFTRTQRVSMCNTPTKSEFLKETEEKNQRLHLMQTYEQLNNYERERVVLYKSKLRGWLRGAGGT